MKMQLYWGFDSIGVFLFCESQGEGEYFFKLLLSHSNLSL